MDAGASEKPYMAILDEDPAFYGCETRFRMPRA